MNKSDYKNFFRILRKLRQVVNFDTSTIGRRARLAIDVKRNTTDGRVGIEIIGTDCDGSDFRNYREIPASVMGVEQFLNESSKWADGPQFTNLYRPDQYTGEGYENDDPSVYAA